MLSTSKSSKTSANSSKSTSVVAKKHSPILQSVHEAAQDLHSIGVIDKTTMREFDALCLPKIPTYTPRQIKAIRSRCHISQAVLARYMNVTPSSLQKWEIGSKKPSGAALKILSLIDTKGIGVLI
jgi:putative transcriptional regulator